MYAAVATFLLFSLPAGVVTKPSALRICFSNMAVASNYHRERVMALCMQWYGQKLMHDQSPKVKMPPKQTKPPTTKWKIRLENAASREKAMKWVVTKYTGSK